MNKKGNIFVVITFFAVIGIVLVMGLMMLIGSSIINWGADIIVPELTSLGIVDTTNLTEVAGYTITPVNNFLQSLTWVMGFFYVILIIFAMIFPLVARVSASRWLMPLFFVLTLSMIMASIFISNIYQDLTVDNDEFTLIMKEHTLLGFLILYSPLITTIICFIGGIFLFSGLGEELS